MPSRSIRFTPRRRKKYGIRSRNVTSETWPRVILLAALVTPTSFRKTFVQLK